MEFGSSVIPTHTESFWLIGLAVVAIILLVVFGKFLRLFGIVFLLVVAGFAYYWWKIGK